MSVAFRSMGMSIVQIGLKSFTDTIGGTLTSYGIIIGIFSVTQSLFQFPFAAVSDRYGRRKVVLIGILIYLTGTFLCFTAQNVIQLTIYRAIQGAGAYSSILQAIIGDIYGKDQHSKGMGYYSLYMNIGYLLGIILGGYISSFLGFRNIFSVSGILNFLSGIFLFIVLREKSKDKTYEPGNMDFKIANIKILLKERQYVINLLINSIRWFIFGFITTYLIWVFRDEIKGFGLDEVITSYLLLAIVTIYVGGVFLSSKLLNRYGARKIMIVGQVIIIGFGIFFFFSDLMYNFAIFLPVITIVGIGISFIDPSGITLLLEIIEDIRPDLKGSGIGFNNAIGFFCSAIAPMLMSPLGELQIWSPFYVVFGLIIISLIITVKMVNKNY